MTPHDAGSDAGNAQRAIELLGDSPACFRLMAGRVEHYRADDLLTVSFPVQPDYCNPAGTMQGGLITGAFDNVFGPLCYLATRSRATTTIDLQTHYHRPVRPGDTLRITAAVKTRGRTKVHMTADAHDGEGRLVATATCTYLVLERP